MSMALDSIDPKLGERMDFAFDHLSMVLTLQSASFHHTTTCGNLEFRVSEELSAR